MPGSPDDLIALADELRPALLRASRRLRLAAQRAGVSVLDAQLLTTIRKHPGVGGAELADREQMSRPSMSAHLKRLEALGWIARDPAHPEDRRRVGVRLTPEGAAALETIRRRRNDWLIERLSGLEADDRRALAAASDALARLAGDL